MALNEHIFVDREIGECFNELGSDSDCRSIVLSGSGRIFTCGLDLAGLGDIVGVVMGDEDVARKCRKLLALVEEFQDSFTAIEKVKRISNSLSVSLTRFFFFFFFFFLNGTENSKFKIYIPNIFLKFSAFF